MQKAEDKKEVPGGKALVVSIHDVSPATRDRTERILSDLESAGVGRVSLLVVPDHHHRGLASEDAAFAEWLRAACAQGNEAVLHGYHHLRENRTTDGPLKRLITRSYTAGEGEFFDLEKPVARQLLDRGRAAVEACGVGVTGFIAPAWLLGMDAEQAVREAGFQYTTRIATVSDLRTGIMRRSRSQVWSVRAGWRRTCSLAWNSLLFQKTVRCPLTRIGIHPPDWDHPAIRGQILRILGKALAARRPMTYEGWLSRMRAAQ
ncbi:MAG: polysaccharide deacetylase family protein [Terrimicrobiaceae bacterium]